VSFLLPFAAGNSIYIADADRIPEVRHHEAWYVNVLHSLSLTAGLGLVVGADCLLHLFSVGFTWCVATVSSRGLTLWLGSVFRRTRLGA
jgi:zinc transporter ZupT